MQHDPPAPVDRSHRREWHWTKRLLQRAPQNAGQHWHLYTPCYGTGTLTRWPHRTLSSHVSRARATLPAPPYYVSLKERDRDPDTDLAFRLNSLSHKPGTRWTRKCSPTRGTDGPVNEHRNVTPSPARRVMRDPPALEHIILDNVTARAGDPGMHSPQEPTHIFSEKVEHQGTRSQGAHNAHWGNLSACNVRECWEGHVLRSPKSYQHQGGRGGTRH